MDATPILAANDIELGINVVLIEYYHRIIFEMDNKKPEQEMSSSSIKEFPLIYNHGYLDVK
jgi:hypothetical protein